MDETLHEPANEDRHKVINPFPTVLWITLIVLALSLFSFVPLVATWLRPLFFLGLLAFFFGLGRAEPDLRSLPFRMLEMGFLLLFSGSMLATLLRRFEVPNLPKNIANSIAFSLDEGLGFLLGFSLITYGIVLWVPEIIESRRILSEHLEMARQRSLKKGLEARQKGRDLEKAQDLIARQEALATIGELAAGVAHELRNPLAILQSALQSMQEEGLNDADRAHCLLVMERATRKANRKINGLLDLGRDSPFLPRLLPAREFLDKAKDLLQPEARAVNLELEVRGVLPESEIFADPEQLLQVLINLLRNAIQAGPHAGPICLRYEALSENPAENPGACRLFVEDQGSGIPEELLPKLCTLFFTTKENGTGLGLNLSARIIDKHGGKLLMENRKGGGARATIELKGRDEEGAAESPSPVELEPHA